MLSEDDASVPPLPPDCGRRRESRELPIRRRRLRFFRSNSAFARSSCAARPPASAIPAPTVGISGRQTSHSPHCAKLSWSAPTGVFFTMGPFLDARV